MKCLNSQVMKQNTNHNTLHQWQLKYYDLKGQGHFDKNGAKIHRNFSYVWYLKWIFTGELVWIVVIA